MNTKTKKRIYIVIIAVIFVVVFILLYLYLPHYKIVATEKGNTSITDAMVLELNAINNILTWGSFIIAALSTIGAVFGIGGSIVFTKHVNGQLDDAKDKIGKSKNEVQKFINEERTKIESFEETIEQKIRNIELKIDDCCEEGHKKMQILESIQIKQEHYFKKSIEYLYMISSNLTEKDDDDTLRDTLYHDLQIMWLYRYEINQDDQESTYISHLKKSALDYLEDYGKVDDIPDLEYVAKNDPNEEIRRKAIETIGVINKKDQLSKIK